MNIRLLSAAFISASLAFAGPAVAQRPQTAAPVKTALDRTKIPPPSSNSGRGLDVVAITGAPQAAASTAGSPYPSLADGSTSATAPLCK